MTVIEFKKRKEPEILFGIKLPSIAMNFYKEIKNKKVAYDIVKNTFNINQQRLINLVDVLDGENNHALVLVIYDNFVTEKEQMRLNLEIEVFDFNIDIDSLRSEGLYGFKVYDKDVYFKGVCPNCLSK